MKKVFSLILCSILLFEITGCGNKKEELKKYEIKEEKSGVIVITDDKNVNNNTKLNVKEDKTDYSNISENINKYVAYDISLSDNNDKINIKNKTEVYLKIPNDYDKEKLVVYYVLDNKIEETFNVEIVKKNKEKYAMFKTNHFSIYVLAELKEKTAIEDINENDIKQDKEDSNISQEKDDNTTTDKTQNNTNKNTSTNKDSNTSSSTNTVNLVGNWKHESSNTYYTFNSDYSGILYVNHTEETVKYTFVWGFQNGNLSIRYHDSGMGSTNDKIKIYNENKIDIQPSKKLIYNRYYGEMPNNKVVQKYLSFKVEYINMPSGLEFSSTPSKEQTWYVRTNNESLLNKTYTATYDLSNCTINSCSVKPTFNTPQEIAFSSSVVASSFNLRNKRYYRDIACTPVYTNFDTSKYNIDTYGKGFKVNTYAENESYFSSSKCQANFDMSHCNQTGECTVLVNYNIISGLAKITDGHLAAYQTILIIENN